MITHIVQWTVKEQAEGLEKLEILKKMTALLETLPAEIEEIQSLQAGVNAKPSDAASDIALVTTFADWDALQRYQVHPEHQKVAEFIKAVASDRHVVDFES